MKKYLLFATALVALASCTSEDFTGDQTLRENNENQQGAAIVFGTGVNTVTRATKIGADAASLLNENFVFAGTKGETPTTFVFDQYNANWAANTAYTTESNTNDWEYVSYTPATTTSLPSGATQTIKYWDYSTTQYDFAAYSLGAGVTSGGSTTYATPTAINAETKSYTLKGSVDELMACYISDLVTAYNRNGVNDYGKPVQFSFRSLGTKIRLAFYETIPGYSVKGIEFYPNASGTSSSTTPTLFTSSAVLPSGSGTMTITFPTKGWSNKAETDYNKAHVAFAQASGTNASSTMEFGALADYPTTYEGILTSGNYLGRASNEATYAGGIDPVSASGKYYSILPYETGANMQLRIKYTLVSTDGSGEEITVDNASAVVPAELSQWKPNYAYTYIFKISDMTNGSTGVDGDNNVVTGLTPITLDAVVVDSEDGVQETITTVSTPSITTYTKGEVVTVNSEYKTNANIYVVVNNGTSNVVLTDDNASLYTVTIESGAAQTISEASVDNALANGVYDSSAKTYTVTDANSKKLVVTESDLLSAITSIPAADSPTGDAITVKVAGTYVFRYVKTAPVAAQPAVYTAVADGTTLTNGVTYYTSDAGAGEFISDGTEVSDGTNYFTLTTPAVAGVPGEYQYKIIKVVE
jgi:hypothetical protein